MQPLNYPSIRPALRRRSFICALTALLMAAGTGFALSRSVAEEFQAIPSFASSESVAKETSETAILAGGCFWGVQGVFQHVKGVTSAVSGYAGGEKGTARYQAISTGTTGHAEAVKITYDPRQISYGRLLQIYFSVAHDPTQFNRQGPDTGSQYRSAIFPANAEQVRIARAYIAQLNQARVFKAAIVTKIEPERPFFAAEDYHQDFLARNPTHPYIAFHDLPKIDGMRRLFPNLYRADPVLVAARR